MGPSRSALARVAQLASAYTVGTAIQRGAVFALIPVLTRLMEPREYGLLALVPLTIALVSQISTCGLTWSAYWACHGRGEEDAAGLPRTISTIGWGLVATSAGAAALWWGFGERTLARFADAPTWRSVLLPAGLAACLSNVPALLVAIYQGLEQPTRYLVAVTFHTVVLHGICLALLFTSAPTAAVYAQGMLLGHGVACLAGLAWLRRRFGSALDPQALWSAFAFGLPLTAHFLSNWVLTYMDRAMLEGFARPRQEIGQYLLGYQIAMIGQLAIGQLASAISPLFQRLATTPATEGRDREALGDVAAAMVAVFAAIAAGNVLFGREVIALVAPPSYREAAGYIPWVALGCFLNGAYFVPLFRLNAHRHTRFVPFASGAAALANFGLNALLIPTAGAAGAAYATAASYGVQLLVATWLAERYGTAVPWRRRSYAASLLATLIAVGAVTVLDTDGAAWPSTLAKVGVFAALLACLWGGSRRELRGVLRVQDTSPGS